MNTQDKCPHCGAEIMEVGERGDWNWTSYLCESYLGVHQEGGFSQSNYCRERTAHAATRKERDSAVDTVDLMRDEFQRIRAKIIESQLEDTSPCNATPPRPVC